MSTISLDKPNHPISQTKRETDCQKHVPHSREDPHKIITWKQYTVLVKQIGKEHTLFK